MTFIILSSEVALYNLSFLVWKKKEILNQLLKSSFHHFLSIELFGDWFKILMNTEQLIIWLLTSFDMQVFFTTFRGVGRRESVLWVWALLSFPNLFIVFVESVETWWGWAQRCHTHLGGIFRFESETNWFDLEAYQLGQFLISIFSWIDFDTFCPKKVIW